MNALHPLVLCSVALVMFPAAACASDFAPSRPLRLVVPFAPGGGSDTMARLISPRLSEMWGQQVVVDNRAGGNTVIGSALVATSPPDGYTLLLANANHTINPAIMSKLPYDTLRDFVSVGALANVANVLVVNASVPAKSVGEFISLARAKPGLINIASPGNGTASHLGAVLLQSMAKIDYTIVPYKGGGPALADLVGGQVSAAIGGMSTVMPHVKTGRLRALGVTTAQRSLLAPDLPTVAEAGLPGFEVTNWYGIVASKGTGRAVATAINRAITQVVSEPDIQKRMAVYGTEPFTASPQDFDTFMRNEVAKWSRLAKAYNIGME
jgi:tripartite-type tricarboxylate transporter receptor subunit TctC